MRKVSSLAIALISPFIGWDAIIHWHDLIYAYTGHPLYAELMTFFATIIVLSIFMVAQYKLWEPELNRFFNPT